MKLSNRWPIHLLYTLVSLFLMSSVAEAQNTIQLPHQSLPSFLGYVEDEFIVVFTPGPKSISKIMRPSPPNCSIR